MTDLERDNSKWDNMTDLERDNYIHDLKELEKLPETLKNFLPGIRPVEYLARSLSRYSSPYIAADMPYAGLTDKHRNLAIGADVMGQAANLAGGGIGAAIKTGISGVTAPLLAKAIESNKTLASWANSDQGKTILPIISMALSAPGVLHLGSDIVPPIATKAKIGVQNLTRPRVKGEAIDAEYSPDDTQIQFNTSDTYPNMDLLTPINRTTSVVNPKFSPIEKFDTRVKMTPMSEAKVPYLSKVFPPGTGAVTGNILNTTENDLNTWLNIQKFNENNQGE